MNGNPNATLHLVIHVTIANYVVLVVLVDSEISCKLMYLKIFMKLCLSKIYLKHYKGKNLLEFNDSFIRSYGCIYLLVSFGIGKNKRITDVHFFVIPCESIYNGIIGISFLTTVDAMASTIHLKMKYHNDSSKLAIIVANLGGA